MGIDKDRLKLAYKKFLSIKPDYDKMIEYYKGNTDSMKNYKMLTERSNIKAPTNFIKLFVDEEVSYSVGNEITYLSKTGDREVLDNIDKYITGMSGAHDVNLLEKMLTCSLAYELYYIDRDGEFNAKVISANNGYAVLDEYGNVEFFLHCFTKDLNDKNYIDVYDSEYIYHYDSDFEPVFNTKVKGDINGKTIEEVYSKSKHPFGDVPVGIATWSVEEDNRHKTVYSSIKGIQDGFETVLSDMFNEISDFRNAYLILKGLSIDPDGMDEMKKQGVIQYAGDGEVKWLIKDINDSFVQNTSSRAEELMYQLTNHINHNETLQANTSSLAIRAKMMGLEQRCKLNQKALGDCVKVRLKMLFRYINEFSTKSYDYRDIKTIFSANLPSDDVITADIINKLGDNISSETALSLLSFIENPTIELKRIQNENEEFYKGSELLDE